MKVFGALLLVLLAGETYGRIQRKQTIREAWTNKELNKQKNKELNKQKNKELNKQKNKVEKKKQERKEDNKERNKQQKRKKDKRKQERKEENKQENKYYKKKDKNKEVYEHNDGYDHNDGYGEDWGYNDNGDKWGNEHNDWNYGGGYEHGYGEYEQFDFGANSGSGGTVLCPGKDQHEYCDCDPTSDCGTDFCECEDAIACCGDAGYDGNGEYEHNLDHISIVGYFPGSSVVDHGNIDLDQIAMQNQIALKTSDGYEAAAAVYGEGGNSKAIATINLNAAASLVKSTELTGTTISGSTTSVSVYAATTNSEILIVKYADFLACKVGGLPDDVQNTDGCLASTGTITDGTTIHSYSNVVNSNERTLKGFSTSVASKMANEKHAIYNTNYYGFSDYADRWVTNALNGDGDNDLNNFKADFDKYGDDGRIEGIKKGTAYMNVFLYAIHELESAIVKCDQDIPISNAIHAWDEGVAFFAGGLEGVDGSGSGALVYALGDKRCKNFRTCGINGNEDQGTSFVNIELVKLFEQGLQHLEVGECEAAEETKDAIADLMYVPVIQGTIRYSWYKANGGSEKKQAEGATFAAACLARVHEADPAAAATIASNMAISATTADSIAVKEAFESVYSSMNINCELVGGLIDSDSGEYQDGMEPCVTEKRKIFRKKSQKLVLCPGKDQQEYCDCDPTSDCGTDFCECEDAIACCADAGYDGF